MAGFAATVMGSGLILSSTHGLKWFLLTVLSYMAVCVGLFFKDIRLFGVWLFAACFPVGIQYKLLTHGNQHFFLKHFGGAPDEPIVNLTDFPLALLILLWIIDIGISSRALPKWTRFDTGVLVFAALSLLSLYNTTEYALFVFEVMRYLKYYLLYWILRTYIDKPNYVWGIIAVGLLMLSLQGVLAMAQYFLHFNVPMTVGGVTESHFQIVGGEVIQRVTGFLGHTNTFAAYLIVPLSSAVILFFAKIRSWRKLPVLAPFVLGSAALFFTFSRNGWLSFAMCAGLIICFALLSGRLSKLIIMFSIALTVFVVGISVGFGLYDDLNTQLLHKHKSSLGVVNTAFTRIFDDDGKAYDSRWDLAGVALEIIKDKPIFGIGLNSFEENMASYDRTGITNVIQQPVHNIYLLIGAETGIPSLIAFLALGGMLVWYSYELTKKDAELSKIVGLLGLCAYIGLGFSNFFDVTLRKDPIIGMVVVVSAMVMAMRTNGFDDVAYEEKAKKLP